MSILLLAVVVITFAGFRFREKPEENFMSPGNTKSLKGLFVLLVLLQHLSEYEPALNGLPNDLYMRFQFYFGQNIVALFLFLSGFGIASRLSEDGKEYLHTFPQRRIAKVLIDFDVAVLFYLLLNYLLGKQYSIRVVLFSLIGWEQVGNSNWFIFVTLLMYILIYVVFSVIKDPKFAIICFLCCNILYVWLFHTFELKPDYFYNTALCFGAGMVFKLMHSWLLKQIQNRGGVYTGALIMIPMLAYYLLRYNYNVWIFNFIAVFIAIWICLFNYRFKVDSIILNFFGDRVFGIYVLQRMPMIILEKIGINVAWAYIPLCLGIVIILEYAYTALLNNIHRKIGISK